LYALFLPFREAQLEYPVVQVLKRWDRTKDWSRLRRPKGYQKLVEKYGYTGTFEQYLELRRKWTRQALNLVHDSVTDAYASVRRCREQIRKVSSWLKEECLHFWVPTESTRIRLERGRLGLQGWGGEDRDLPKAKTKCKGCKIPHDDLHWSTTVRFPQPPAPAEYQHWRYSDIEESFECRWCKITTEWSVIQVSSSTWGGKDGRYVLPDLAAVNNTSFPTLRVLSAVVLRNDTWNDYKDRAYVWRCLLREEVRIQRELSASCNHPSWRSTNATDRSVRKRQYKQNRCVCDYGLRDPDVFADHYRSQLHIPNRVTCSICETTVSLHFERPIGGSWSVDEDPNQYLSDHVSADYSESSDEPGTGWCQAIDYRERRSGISGTKSGDGNGSGADSDTSDTAGPSQPSKVRRKRSGKQAAGRKVARPKKQLWWQRKRPVPEPGSGWGDGSSMGWGSKKDSSSDEDSDSSS